MSEEYLEGKELVEDLYMNGQKVELVNPGLDFFGDFLMVAKDFGKAKEGESPLDYLTPTSIKAMTDLVEGTLKETFPDMWEKKRDELKRWGFENAMTIAMAVVGMCMPKSKTHEAKKIEKLKSRLVNEPKPKV